MRQHLKVTRFCFKRISVIMRQSQVKMHDLGQPKDPATFRPQALLVTYDSFQDYRKYLSVTRVPVNVQLTRHRILNRMFTTTPMINYNLFRQVCSDIPAHTTLVIAPFPSHKSESDLDRATQGHAVGGALGRVTARTSGACSLRHGARCSCHDPA